ncbi:UPF0481 protein At3g47200-like [Typha latifolia]|uniref:UPF0481 protein At3g47200-like n=1 Tax=Typha latifolia TaxID=4733 RepID=UPI003C2CAFED
MESEIIDANFQSSSVSTEEISEECLKRVKEKVEQKDLESGTDTVALKLARALHPERGPNIFKLNSKGHDKELHQVRAVAIGPYHRGNNDRIITDDYKWQFVRYMVQCYKLKTEEYLRFMKSREPLARGYYSDGASEMDSESFLEMLLVDSCFILFVINKLRQSSGPGYVAHEFMRLSMDVSSNAKLIKIDLLRLENQIPFFAIKRIIVDSTNAKNFIQGSIEKIALSFFDDLYPQRNRDIQNRCFPRFHHLLELFHWSRVPNGKYKLQNSSLIAMKKEPTLHIPSATELQESATEFTKKGSGSFLDITFKHGAFNIWAAMEIPTLHIHDYSTSIFHNLIAFENNYLNCGLCVTAYSACMARILQSEKDAKLLRRRGILAKTQKTDIEVVRFFEGLSDEIEGAQMPDDLFSLYSTVMGHHENQLSKYYGEFKLHYCLNPWITVSVIGATLLFILTLIQTIYTMLGYYAPIHG